MNEPSLSTPAFPRGSTVKTLLRFINSVKILTYYRETNKQNRQEEANREKKKKGGQAANTRAALRPGPALSDLCACAGGSAAAGLSLRAGGAQRGECLTWQFPARLQLCARDQPVVTQGRGKGAAGAATAAGAGSPGAPGARSRAQALGSPAACGSRPGSASPCPATRWRDSPSPGTAGVGCGARPRMGVGERLDAHLWQGSGGDLRLSSFSLFVQFNNGGGVGGRGHFLPAPAPIFLSWDAGTAWLGSSVATVFQWHGQRFSCLCINLISSLEEGSIGNRVKMATVSSSFGTSYLVAKPVCPNPNLVQGEKRTLALLVQ